MLNSESHKLLLLVNLLDVPLPCIMASQENHQAGVSYQLPVLDEKWSRWVSDLRVHIETWRAEALCQPPALPTLSVLGHGIGLPWSLRASPGDLFLWRILFPPCSTKEKDFVSGKQLLTFAWHLSKIQILVKFQTLSKAFHFQQLKRGKIPHFLQSVPKPSQLLFQTRLWEQRAPHVSVCLCVMTICMEQHQPHRHLGWELTPQSWGTFRESFLQLSFQTNLGQMWKLRAGSLSLLNKHSGTMEGHTRLDEEVGGAFQLEVSNKPDVRFLFITKKWLGMRVREERWALVAQDDVLAQQGAVFLKRNEQRCATGRRETLASDGCGQL